jgi:phosphatidylglycerophosphate synthase
MVSLAGTLGVVFSSCFIAFGRFTTAGVLLIVFTPFDALDGELARETKTVTPFGGILDSTLDRYQDACITGGLCLFFARAGDMLFCTIILAALVGSLCVSYVKARAENETRTCSVGLSPRAIRIGICIVMLLSGMVKVGSILLCFITHVTVVQRLYHSWKLLQDSS